MSTTVELVREAAATVDHGASILRVAALDAEQQAQAAELWKAAKSVEKVVESLNDLIAAAG